MSLVAPDGPLSVFAQTIIDQKYAHTKPSGRKETWSEIAHRVTSAVCGPYIDQQTQDKIEKLIRQRKLMPGGRYLYAAGRPYHPVNNCYLFRAEDSRQGWASLSNKVVNTLMSGGGIGIDYDPVRGEGALVKGLGGFCTGPCALMQMVNEDGRHIMQGGSRRSAIWARLGWKHPDVNKFITLKDWPDWLVAQKLRDFNTPAPMDMTNISVGLDDRFFDSYRVGDRMAHQVYWDTVRHMVETAEPGFSIDVGPNAGETLRNACTEVSSHDDCDVCDLASLVLPRFATVEEFEEAVDLGTLFLLCGTLYSDLPLEECRPVVEKNRRLGLGLMGFHEWLLRRGYAYGHNPELQIWLERFATSTEKAHVHSDRMGISRSAKTRALAPNGTIAIAAETVSCMEPIFAVAQRRRYLTGQTWKFQYIIDAAADRLIKDGVDPDAIEDAYDLAEDVERRVSFQAFVQGYVDHGISSTINLPAWGSSINNENTVQSFGRMLLKYLPKLRGLTCYPDGSRGGQPLKKVKYQTAIRHLGQEFESSSESDTPEPDHVLTVEEYSAQVGCPGGICGL